MTERMQKLKDMPVTMTVGTASVIVVTIIWALLSGFTAWSNHETRLAVVETQIHSLNETLKGMWSDIKDIRDHLMK